MWRGCGRRPPFGKSTTGWRSLPHTWIVTTITSRSMRGDASGRPSSAQTYKADSPAVRVHAVLVSSDGVEARVGTLTAGASGSSPGAPSPGEALRRTAPARAAGDSSRASSSSDGLPRPDRATSSSSRTTGAGRIAKKMAGYHQFHAVQRGGGRDAARRGAAPRGRSSGRRRGSLRGGPPAGRRARRPARRRRLAHAGLRQEPDDGVLRRPGHPRAGDGEPDDRRPHRPQRPGRPALRHVRALPGPAAADAGAGRRAARTCASCSAWRRAAWSSRRSRSSSPRRRATGTRCSRSGATSS